MAGKRIRHVPLFGGAEEPKRPVRRRISHATEPEIQSYVAPPAPPARSLPSPPGSLVRHGGVESEAHARGDVIRSDWKKVGARRGGAKGIWFQGKWLLEAGFSPGDKVTVKYDRGQRTITIALNDAGERLLTVSQKEGVPVIDVSNVDVADVVGNTDKVHFETVYGRITITRGEAEAMAVERLADRNNLEGSLFSGAGFLTLAATQAGYVPATAAEIDPVCATVYQSNHPTARLYGDILDLTLKIARGRVTLPHVDLVTAGIPCQPYSVVRRWADESRDVNVLDAMTQAYLNVIMTQNPANMVIEQVEDYLETEVYRRGLVSWLRILGYHVQDAVLDANDFGLPTGRRRAVIVVTSVPAPGLIEDVARAASKILPKTAGDILLPPSSVEGLHPVQGGWFTARSREDVAARTDEILRDEAAAEAAGHSAFPGWYLPEQWERGKYPPQFIDENTPRIQAIIKNYWKPNPAGPFVVHPTRANTYRLLTVEEIKRMHGVPDDYQLTGHYPTDVSLLGQGIVVPVFRAVIEALPGGRPVPRRNPSRSFDSGLASLIAQK